MWGEPGCQALRRAGSGLEDDVVFSLFFEFSLANFFDQVSLVDNAKTIGNQIKARTGCDWK